MQILNLILGAFGGLLLLYAIACTSIILKKNRKIKSLSDYKLKSIELLKKQTAMLDTMKNELDKLMEQVTSGGGMVALKGDKDLPKFLEKILNKAKKEVLQEAPEHMRKEIEISHALIKVEEGLVENLMKNIQDIFKFISDMINSTPELHGQSEDSYSERFEKLKDHVINDLNQSNYDAFKSRKALMKKHGSWEKEKKSVIKGYTDEKEGSPYSMISFFVLRDEAIDEFKNGKYESIISFIPERIENDMQLSFINNSRDMIVKLCDNPNLNNQDFDTLSEKDQKMRIALEKMAAITERYKILNTKKK